jgi:hypothetical protein
MVLVILKIAQLGGEANEKPKVALLRQADCLR